MANTIRIALNSARNFLRDPLVQMIKVLNLSSQYSPNSQEGTVFAVCCLYPSLIFSQFFINMFQPVEIFLQ